MAGYGLSKSRITAWRQCPKRLWLQIHRRKLLEESDQVKRLYQIGNEVGEIAQRLCPDGILIEDQNNLAAAIVATKSALEVNPNRPLFEATFQHEGLLVRADVLLPTRKGYRMTEVKSSASVKSYHIDDCAVQAWVLKQNNIRLASVELAYIDKSFVYQGDGNYHGLLKAVRLDAEVKELLDQVPLWVSGARTTLAGDEPCIEPGAQCDDPFECPFKAYCMRDMDIPEEPEYPLGVLSGLRESLKHELHELGYHDARHVPVEYLNDKQSMIQRASKTGKPKFDKHAAKQGMAALPYPRYYLDFETVSPAVPRWAGTSPSSPHVPFQWSCHIEYAPGKLRHDMFLDVSGNDPRQECAESLIRVLAKDGPVLVFSSFETARITELAQRFPDLAPALLSINERVVDLLPMARKHYYHPAMKGSWSLKAVLPTIAPDLRYDELEVSNGGEAQHAYSEIIHPETAQDRKRQLTESLHEYCALDTLAMVRLAWFLEGRKTNKGGDYAAQ
ncbi:MAG: DUF2779 domain-containing protein [Nitrosomonadales bacterium]|nr:DUF2779 domain-containing protein [Nitrosomonadales bacterium]